MISVESINAFIGFVLPFGVAFLNRQSYSRATKLLVCFGAALVIALVTALVGGSFDPQDLPASVFAVFASAQVSYAVFKSKIEALEKFGNADPAPKAGE